MCGGDEVELLAFGNAISEALETQVCSVKLARARLGLGAAEMDVASETPVLNGTILGEKSPFTSSICSPNSDPPNPLPPVDLRLTELQIKEAIHDLIGKVFSRGGFLETDEYFRGVVGETQAVPFDAFMQVRHFACLGFWGTESLAFSRFHLAYPPPI